MAWMYSWILHGLKYLLFVFVSYVVNILSYIVHVIFLLYVIIMQLYQGCIPTQCIVNPSPTGHPFMTLVCDSIFVFIFCSKLWWVTNKGSETVTNVVTASKSLVVASNWKLKIQLKIETLENKEKLLKEIDKENVKGKWGQQECGKWHNFWFYSPSLKLREEGLWKKLVPVILYNQIEGCSRSSHQS